MNSTSSWSRKSPPSTTFIPIANVKDKKKYDDLGILLEYKNQSSIETKFRFLKSPVYLGPVFLEKPERVHALCYVFMLVLLVASYLEYRLRQINHRVC